MKIAKIVAYLAVAGFVGWCISTGNAAEERREAIILQQQEHDLQMSRMAKAKLSDIHEVGENK